MWSPEIVPFDAAQLTVAPLTGFPAWSVTTTMNGAASACCTRPSCPEPRHRGDVRRTVCDRADRKAARRPRMPLTEALIVSTPTTPPSVYPTLADPSDAVFEVCALSEPLPDATDHDTRNARHTVRERIRHPHGERRLERVLDRVLLAATRDTRRDAPDRPASPSPECSR